MFLCIVLEIIREIHKLQKSYNRYSITKDAKEEILVTFLLYSRNMLNRIVSRNWQKRALSIARAVFETKK